MPDTNLFLVYFSEAFLQQTKSLNSIIQSLNQLGAVRPADFNISVVETSRDGADVYKAISDAAPNNASFFVASVAELGYQGDAQFSSAMRLLSEQTRRQCK